jgi:hypothetical protein
MTAERSLLPRKTGLEALELIASERQRKGCSLEVSQRPALQVSSAVTLRDKHHTTPALARLYRMGEGPRRLLTSGAVRLDGYRLQPEWRGSGDQRGCTRPVELESRLIELKLRTFRN